jgi:DNA mismatch repair protein MutL
MGAPSPSDFSQPAALTEAPSFSGKSVYEFKILGVLGKLYILMENGEGLVLVDQHAAHERILFEKLRREMESAGLPTQRLLIPLTECHAQGLRLDHDKRADSRKMGFSLEPFGNSTLKIDGIPQFFFEQ